MSVINREERRRRNYLRSWGRKIGNIGKKLETYDGRLIDGGMEITSYPNERIWINGKEYTYAGGAEELSALFEKRITVEWLESLMRYCERREVRGVEIAMYPTVT